jgi:hypothetical protein
VRLASSVVLALACASAVGAQTFSGRGFAEGRGFFYPQTTITDADHVIGDALLRAEAFFKPAPWIQFAAGLDARAGDQVEDSWHLDFSDRTAERPRLSVRRLSATLTRHGFTVDVGKQFIRWGKTDIVTPTDRFAPRDFLYVFEYEFIAVTGVRASATAGTETFEAVWVPRFTPSRIPLPDRRWSVVPADTAPGPVVDAGRVLPEGSQVGFRWSHVSTLFEASASYFDGFNNLPDVRVDVKPNPLEIDATTIYPAIRSFGGDAAVPLRWLTVKAEAAYVTSQSLQSDEYVLYVVQLERQSGEWVFVGGYAGEVVTEHRSLLAFAPDRGVTRALLGRASYTIDPNRSAAFEGALRQNGDGGYARGEYSQTYGQHWRATVAGTLVRGKPTDFFGQYRRNSHVTLSLRYSF